MKKEHVTPLKEELISFETAKLAKDKGFNWKVSLHYESNGDRFFDKVECNFNNVELICSAPTQSLLQKWLREVHNIIVTSKPYQDDVSNETDEDIEFQTLWENEILDVKDSYNIFSDYTFYHSYEEALEIGLYQALKLIKKS